MKLATPFFLCFLIAAVISCHSAKNATQKTHDGNPSMAVVSYPLIDTHWQLKELDEKDVSDRINPMEVPSILFMEDNTIGAFDGCNYLAGPYKISNNMLTFGEVISSMKACEGQTLESAFRRVLIECDNYVIQGSFLQLQKGKKSLARFEAVAPEK